MKKAGAFALWPFPILVRMTHRVFDIKPRIYFFPGIKDIVRVKNMFSLLKQFKHRLAEHLVQERGAHDAVVVFSADIAFIFDGSIVEFLSHSGHE